MTGTEERQAREGFERWVDERIHAALSNLTNPFEKRIHALQQRVERLRDRFQTLSKNMDSLSTKSKESRRTRKTGGGSRK
jgi:hypothetical protein